MYFVNIIYLFINLTIKSIQNKQNLPIAHFLSSKILCVLSIFIMFFQLKKYKFNKV